MRISRTWDARSDILEFDVREVQVSKPRRGSCVKDLLDNLINTDLVLTLLGMTDD